MRKKGNRAKSTPPTARQLPTAANKSAAGIESDDSRAIEEFVQGLPSEQRAQLAMRLVESYTIEQTFTGPLPPPDHFAKYERTLPGAADRILSMAEQEQQIRADTGTQILKNDEKRINSSTLLGVGLLVIAGIAAWQGAALIALPLGLAGVMSTLFRQWFANLGALQKPKV